MRIKLWGARGSIPTPITNEKLQSKIAAIVQRIQPIDLESPESRERFLANLPPYLFGTVGGNTTCIEVQLDDSTTILFDAGSGIIELGEYIKKTRRRIKEFHIFFTHFHWDHIQGIPFFSPPMFDPETTIHFYSPVENFESVIRGQMDQPYFPVDFDVLRAKKIFHVLKGQTLKIKGSTIAWSRMKHPGESFSYSVSESGKKMIFSTDTELTEENFERNDYNKNFYENSDVIILDSQYTLDEAIDKYGWGHSSYSLTVDFAVAWKIKQLVLFHHEPKYDDKKIHSIHKSAGWYLSHMDQRSDLKIHLGYEGLEIKL